MIVKTIKLLVTIFFVFFVTSNCLAYCKSVEWTSISGDGQFIALADGTGWIVAEGDRSYSRQFSATLTDSYVDICGDFLTARFKPAFGGAEITISVQQIPGCKIKEPHGISADGRIIVLTDATTLLVDQEDIYHSKDWQSGAIFWGSWGDTVSCDNHLIYNDTRFYKQNETVRTTDLTQCLMLLVNETFYDGHVVQLSDGSYWKVKSGADYVNNWNPGDGIMLCSGYIVGPNYEIINVTALDSLEDNQSTVPLSPIFQLLLLKQK